MKHFLKVIAVATNKKVLLQLFFGILKFKRAH